MRRALKIGAAQSGRTAENPAVGCVIVKDGEIIGEGATQDGGRPHAETVALHVAGSAARGATVYVTLEPCSHYGQTSPCADALIEAGIAICHIAVYDSDPRVSTRGARRMSLAGIDVRVGCCEPEAIEAHAEFFSRFESEVGETDDEGRPIRVVTKEELAEISGAFGYGSASPHGWATKRVYELLQFIENGGVLEIQGVFLPGRLDSVTKFMLWRNEIWGIYFTD